MAVYSLQRIQRIPVEQTVAWSFFSDPSNLEAITPKAMDFKVISKYQGNKMYPGQIIEYKVKPLLGIPVYWMTEITHVVENKFFVDEQRFGPYSFWHHQHHFKPIDGGVEMTDIVHYKNPFWILGDLANSLFVKRKLEEIFDFRYKVVEERFGAWNNDI